MKLAPSAACVLGTAVAAAAAAADTMCDVQGRKKKTQVSENHVSFFQTRWEALGGGVGRVGRHAQFIDVSRSEF